jgi:hypothetical protein
MPHLRGIVKEVAEAHLKGIMKKVTVVYFKTNSKESDRGTF